MEFTQRAQGKTLTEIKETHTAHLVKQEKAVAKNEKAIEGAHKHTTTAVTALKEEGCFPARENSKALEGVQRDVGHILKAQERQDKKLDTIIEKLTK